MVKRKLYIIAHSQNGLGPEIHIFFEKVKANKFLRDNVDKHYKNPHNIESDDPEGILSTYYDWVLNENNHVCDNEFAIKTLIVAENNPIIEK